jgi:1,4-dihydroxy-2-naphthoyl-CoA hydrolase
MISMFQYLRTVRFSDTDGAGVVYFARILSICHEAYESSLESCGIGLREFFSQGAIAVPIVHTEADFFAPLFCGDKLLITLDKTLLSDSEFEINYQIFRESSSNKVLAKGKTRHVCISTVSRARTQLSDFLLRWLDLEK